LTSHRSAAADALAVAAAAAFAGADILIAISCALGALFSGSCLYSQQQLLQLPQLPQSNCPFSAYCFPVVLVAHSTQTALEKRVGGC